MENQIVRVGFHGGAIEAVKQGNDVFVSVRRACEHLGIDDCAQRAKLQSKEWAIKGLIPSVAEDGKIREQFMLHLESVPMWLATIDANKVNKSAKTLLIAYQREAAKVLRDHFFGQKLALPSYSEALRQLADSLENNEQLEKEKKELLLREEENKPFTTAGWAMRSSDDACTIELFAKSINIDGVTMGRDTMFEFLRDCGLLQKYPKNIPYQEQINLGRFKVNQKPYEKNGKTFINHQTVITLKGQGYVVNLIIKDPKYRKNIIEYRGQIVKGIRDLEF